eukprot:6208913-Pleurochrysis_carterae.AAC.2
MNRRQQAGYAMLCKPAAARGTATGARHGSYYSILGRARAGVALICRALGLVRASDRAEPSRGKAVALHVLLWLCACVARLVVASRLPNTSAY